MKPAKHDFNARESAALSDWDRASNSHDLHAFGHTRRNYGRAAVRATFAVLAELGITDALTKNELEIARSCGVVFSL